MVDNFELLVNESKIQEILSKLQEQFQLQNTSSVLVKAFWNFKKDEREEEEETSGIRTINCKWFLSLE